MAMSISTIDVDEATRLGFATHAALSRREVGVLDISTMAPQAKLDLLRQALDRLEQLNLLTNDQSKVIQHFASTGERPATRSDGAPPTTGPWSVAGVFGTAMAHSPAARSVPGTASDRTEYTGSVERSLDGDDPQKQTSGVEFVIVVAEAVLAGYAIGGPVGAIIGGLLAIFG
jgi:hypothetical protein